MTPQDRIKIAIEVLKDAIAIVDDGEDKEQLTGELEGVEDFFKDDFKKEKNKEWMSCSILAQEVELATECLKNKFSDHQKQRMTRKEAEKMLIEEYKSSNVSNGILETNINDWIEENNIEIID